MIGLVVSMNLDVPAIERRLLASELRILRAHQRAIVMEIKAGWTGWKYVGRKPETVGRSRAAWTGKVQATETPFSMTIENHARSYYGGRPYVEFVARSKGAEPEHLKVAKWLVFERLPVVARELSAAILKSIAEGATGPQKVIRTSSPGARRSASLS